MKKLITLLLVLVLCLGMAACGDKNSPSAALKADIENSKSSPDDIITDELIKSFGEEAGQAFVDKMLDFDYKLGEETVDGDTATVETTITTYPFGEIFTDVLTEYVTEAMADTDMSEEESTKLLGDLMTKALDSAEKSYETVVSIELVKVDDKWEVQESDEMANALTGGIYDMAGSLGSE